MLILWYDSIIRFISYKFIFLGLSVHDLPNYKMVAMMWNYFYQNRENNFGGNLYDNRVYVIFF